MSIRNLFEGVSRTSSKPVRSVQKLIDVAIQTHGDVWPSKVENKIAEKLADEHGFEVHEIEDSNDLTNKLMEFGYNIDTED